MIWSSALPVKAMFWKLDASLNSNAEVGGSCVGQHEFDRAGLDPAGSSGVNRQEDRTWSFL